MRKRGLGILIGVMLVAVSACSQEQDRPSVGALADAISVQNPHLSRTETECIADAYFKSNMSNDILRAAMAEEKETLKKLINESEEKLEIETVIRETTATCIDTSSLGTELNE